MMLDYLPSNGRLRAFRRVVLVDGVLSLADSKSAAYGHIISEGVSYGDGQPVYFRGLGVAKLEADGPIKAGADVFATDEGRVSAKGKVLEGKATTAAMHAGDVIEVAWRMPSESESAKDAT